MLAEGDDWKRATTGLLIGEAANGVLGRLEGLDRVKFCFGIQYRNPYVMQGLQTYVSCGSWCIENPSERDA